MNSLSIPYRRPTRHRRTSPATRKSVRPFPERSRNRIRFAGWPGSIEGSRRPRSRAGWRCRGMDGQRRGEAGEPDQMVGRRRRSPGSSRPGRASRQRRSCPRGRPPQAPYRPGARPARGLASLTRRIRSGVLADTRTFRTLEARWWPSAIREAIRVVLGGLVPDRVGVARQRRGDPVAEVGREPGAGVDSEPDRRTIGRGVTQGDHDPFGSGPADEVDRAGALGGQGDDRDPVAGRPRRERGTRPGRVPGPPRAGGAPRVGRRPRRSTAPSR